jgi:anti-sigma factor RsiW
LIFRWWRRTRRGGQSGPTNALSCKELVELVTDYLEGALDEATRTRFEEHIATCDGCTEYVEQMRETIRLVGHVDETQLSPQARTKLLAAFDDWKNTSS